MLTQAMDYDRILAGSRSHQTGVSGENNSVRLSIQGGHLGHDNNGGIARGATPESSGSYGFVRLEGDLLRTEVAGMSLTTGVYGAAGHSSVDVKDDDGSRAGTVRDDAGSLGGYLNLTHTSSGLWADIVAQGTRHSMKASSDNNDFRARGWGWLGSLETGLPFSITDNLMLEPQLQYTWQGTPARKIHLYHCDHRGLPLALISTEGATAWCAEYDEWGNLLNEENPHQLQQLIRLPGQQYDEESGLYYNRHRYYDPLQGERGTPTNGSDAHTPSGVTGHGTHLPLRGFATIWPPHRPSSENGVRSHPGAGHADPGVSSETERRLVPGTHCRA